MLKTTYKVPINAYVIHSSKIPMSHFTQIAEDPFRVVIRKQLCNVRITEASRTASNWTRHCFTTTTSLMQRWSNSDTESCQPMAHN